MKEESTEPQVLSVYWSDLAPHYRRDALWVFNFDLKEIATAIIEDQTRVIQAWIDSGALRKPESSEVEVWSSEESGSEDETANKMKPRFYFHAVIIQPFVIMAPTPLVFRPSASQPKT